MITVSDQFLAAIRAPHQLAIRATVTAPDWLPPPTTLDPPGFLPPVEIPISDGTVTIDRFADHRRRLDLTISDPTLYPEHPHDAVNVYGSYITVWRGIRYGTGEEELVELGQFRIEDATRDIPGGALQITGWDASRQVLDERFPHPRKFAAQHAIDLIQLLILEVDPTATFDVQTTRESGTSLTPTTIPKHVVDRDRWPEIQRIATVIGCDVYPGVDGVWVIADTPDPATAVPVWTVDAGANGVLVTASNSVSRESAPNAVVALGENVSGNNPPVWSLATDTNPASPTFEDSSGPYGFVPRFYSSPHIRTQAQADRVAAAQLADHLGATRLVQFTTIVNPALEAGDAVTIVYPDGSSELHIVDALTIPLSPSGAMTAETRALAWDAA